MKREIQIDTLGDLVEILDRRDVDDMDYYLTYGDTMGYIDSIVKHHVTPPIYQFQLICASGRRYSLELPSISGCTIHTIRRKDTLIDADVILDPGMVDDWNVNELPDDVIVDNL